MRFKAYKIVKEDIFERVTISDEENLYKALVQTPKSEDEDNQDEYAIMYLTKEHEYILGTLVQSYTKVLTKFDESLDDKKEVKLKDSKINDKTLFYINSNEGILYIQSKRFPEYLTEGLMKLRMQDILSKCFGYRIQILPTEISYSIEQVEEIFMTSSVKRIAFKNLNGLELPKGVELHNPKKELDESLAETYNVYCKDTLGSMEFKAQRGRKLGKNPFARIGLALAKHYNDVDVFKDMEINENGEKVTIKTKGNDSKIINIPKNKQDVTSEAYKLILKNNIKNYKDEE